MSLAQAVFAAPPLPAVKVSVRARKETIEVARDTTTLMRAAILSHRRFLAGLRPALLAAAREAYAAGGDLRFDISETGRARQLAEILAAAEVAGRLRTRKQALGPWSSLGLNSPTGEFTETWPRSVPPEKAIAYIKSLPAVERSQWEAFIRKHQGRAFTVAGVEQRAVLESLRDLIAESLRAGLTPAQFNARAQDLLRNFEISGGRLRTVWNQTVGSALRQGSAEALDDPDVRRVLSWALFDAIIDQVVRENHGLLEGAVAPLDWWEGPGSFYSPVPDGLGFNCRCQLIYITGARAQQLIGAGARDLSVDGPPAGAGPDPGYKGAF